MVQDILSNMDLLVTSSQRENTRFCEEEYCRAMTAQGNNTLGHGNSRMSDIVTNISFNIPSAISTFSENHEVIKK